MQNNSLEFHLKIKDMMSSGLMKVGQNAKNSFLTVQQAAAKAQNGLSALVVRNNTLASSYDNLKTKAKQLENVISSSRITSQIQAATREFKALNKEMSTQIANPNKVGNTSGGLMSKLGIGGMLSRFAPAAMLSGGLMLAGNSVNAAMNYGATTKSYEVLAGNATKGRELAGGLNQLQQNTILGPEVFKAGQTLMGFGVASERVLPIVKQLGDVAMGDAQKFESLTLAFAQTQAAGRLMGQDLLQYVNAGFNPLQTMSEKWQEFGFKQQMSIGQLKEAMEKGAISSNMVAKAFEIATNKGGKFANMMDTIGQTAYGKMKVMEGQWEAFKIKFGGMMMPIATAAMGAATGIIGLATSLEKASNQITLEKFKVNGLAESIVALNEGSELRKQKLQELVQTYPDLFGKIDTEKIKNRELLSILGDVNNAYDKRIQLATSREIVKDYQGKINSQESRAARLRLAASLVKSGNKDLAYENLQADDVAGSWLFGASDDKIVKRLEKDASKFEAGANSFKSPLTSIKLVNRIQEIKALTNQASGLFGNAKAMDEVFAKNPKAKQDFIAEFSRFKALSDTQKINNYDLATLQSKMSPSKITSGGSTTSEAAKIEANSIGKSVASGGVRTINIHGVKFMDKLELHTSNLTEGVADIETKLEEMFLRILNSGATVQG